MSSGPIVAMELMGSNVIQDWRNILGPTNSAEAREVAPNTVRAKFGSDNTRNAAHGSDSEKSANRVGYVHIICSYMISICIAL